MIGPTLGTVRRPGWSVWDELAELLRTLAVASSSYYYQSHVSLLIGTRTMSSDSSDQDPFSSLSVPQMDMNQVNSPDTNTSFGIDNDPLFHVCWRRQDCRWCLQGDVPCSWCAVVSTYSLFLSPCIYLPCSTCSRRTSLPTSNSIPYNQPTNPIPTHK